MVHERSKFRDRILETCVSVHSVIETEVPKNSVNFFGTNLFFSTFTVDGYLFKDYPQTFVFITLSSLLPYW